MKTLILLSALFLSGNIHAWYLLHPETGRPYKCPEKSIPIIDEYEKHFIIPMGGPKGGEYIFDMITTDFLVRGYLNGTKKVHHMHCAEFVKKDCEHCDTTKPSHENYCVHYIHPTKGHQQGCLARGSIPTY